MKFKSTWPESVASRMYYWAFDCLFNASAEAAEKIFSSEINQHIDAAVVQELPEFYVEILARACKHLPRPSEDTGE
ncbi:DUF6172 family protein [Alkalimonas collagenimarina]|uniref:DUF6172 family protein n=1 Tax=Alkalimonas collagenimarina TaxID=400390 RepID=UPI00350EAA66